MYISNEYSARIYKPYYTNTNVNCTYLRQKFYGVHNMNKISDINGGYATYWLQFPRFMPCREMKVMDNNACIMMYNI